jgi:hypothetical protein
MAFQRAHHGLRKREHERLFVFAGLAPASRATALATLALCTLVADQADAATPASFTATALQPLTFGTLVTASGGSRIVGPDGSTSSSGVFPLGDSTSAPAEFTLVYTRASGTLISVLVTFQFSLPAPPTVNIPGISGKLSAFTTDLPGVPTLQPGQTATYIMPACVSPTCAVTFHIGGTLTITRSSGGGNLTFPLTLLATVTTALG